MQANQIWENDQLDLNVAASVKAVFDNITNAVQTINVSLVMTNATH